MARDSCKLVYGYRVRLGLLPREITRQTTTKSMAGHLQEAGLVELGWPTPHSLSSREEPIAFDRVELAGYEILRREPRVYSQRTCRWIAYGSFARQGVE